MSELPDPSWVHRVVGVADALAHVVVVGVGLVVMSVLAGFSEPAPLLAVQGMIPLSVPVVAVIVIVVVAAVRRRRILVAVGVVVVGALAVLCVPQATADEQPSWVASAPSFRLYSANIRFDNDRAEAAVAAIMQADADVVVGEVSIDVWAVHPDPPPTAAWSTGEWQRGLADLASAARRSVRARPLVMAGDVNASSFHGAYEDLLDGGFRDVHDQLGEGLGGSWGPAEFGPLTVPLIRLDHAVVSDGVAGVSVGNLDLPGSDHRPFAAKLAVRPA